MDARRARIHQRAASFAEKRRARKPVGRPRDQRFNPLTFPWRDERRFDLIRAYLADATKHVEDDTTGAVMAITGMTFVAGADEQWDVILEVIAEAPDEDRTLQCIAAGPLEGFLGRFDTAVIDRVEEEAARDPKFRRVLSGVWRHRMSAPVWERVRVIQAAVPNPLPEMHAFGTDESSPVA
jgi:hypothetical protein